MNAWRTRMILGLIAASIPLLMLGCGGTSSSSLTGQQGAQDGNVSMMVSDAPSNDWAAIDVKILTIALNPQGGGTPVTVYTSPSGTMLNLVELDQLGELLGNVKVPVGTYTSATLTLSANPGDVVLTASDDPDPGFAGTAGVTIASGQTQIQGATGSAGSKTVALNINLVTPLAVSANQNNALDLEFDLSHPAFIVGHVPPTAVPAAPVLWAVNFNGPVHHHPIWDITHFLLRDLYGTVGSVSGTDDSTITITKDFPVEPPTNPETDIASSQTVSILADGTNGTLYYDLDAKAQSTIFNFSSVSITGKFVRIAARYESGGTLVAVRVWASSNSFDTVWENPEGHVLHVNTATDILSVEKENGGHINLQVVDGANPTQFYFRTPGSAQSDSTAIGSGTAFLSNLKRGFKVHVLANPLTSPETAVSVDIETARFDGLISNAANTGFDYTRIFNTATDSYTNFPLNYISSSTANGMDPITGASITGFKWWNFAFPTLVTSNVTDTSTTQTINDFVSATSDSVNFGGSVGPLAAYGTSNAIWGNPGNPGWAAPFTVLLPTPVPLGTVATGYSNGSGDFTMIANGGTNTPFVDVDAISGSATLVYQVDRTNGVVTISPVNITTASGLTTFENNMVSGTVVRIAGLPESNGHIKAYVIFYFTGTAPVS